MRMFWSTQCRKNKILMIAAYVVFLLLLCLALFIPQVVLAKKFEKTIGIVNHDNGKYYGEQLSLDSKTMNFYDKVNLVNGDLAINTIEITEPSQYNCMELIDAVGKIKSISGNLFAVGDYPVFIYSDYKNWYSYTGTLYQYTEQYFGNYSCYIWVVRFTLYDKSEEHTIYLDAQTGDWYAMEMEGAAAKTMKNKVKLILNKDVEGKDYYQVSEVSGEKYKIYFTDFIQP